MAQRKRNRALFSMMMAACCVFTSSQAWAANTPITSIQGKQFKDWGGNCERTQNNQPVCYLEQVLSQGNNQLMVSVIGYPPGQNSPTVVFELPAKVHAPAGFSLQVDNNPPIRFKGTCTAERCTAGFALDQVMLQQFKKGRQAIMTYTPAPHQPVVQLPLSLLGITAGLAAIIR